ncbi:hypothetical protein HB774_24085 [Rhizobium leguminosarum bv. viciae]|nr:hypothetical protein HB774_24085 [Rhizobium leguminosarum bv. viciae]
MSQSARALSAGDAKAAVLCVPAAFASINDFEGIAAMSIKVMSIVWSRAPVQGGDLLMLLALADNADENGVAFPAVPYLASKARMTERNVQLCLRKLQRDGFIQIVPRAGPSGANKYRLNISLMRDLPDDFVPAKGESDGEDFSPVKNFHR